MSEAKKSLGQHWLKDQKSLAAVVEAADLTKDDTVLEIGPGLGDLTKLLAAQAAQVVAVELDQELASKLPTAPNLTVINQDILKFDLTSLPIGYKVVANIPYYLTSHLLRSLTESTNPPQNMVLLVQKEVAERLASQPGQMSVLAISLQLDYEVELAEVIAAKLFVPPPKVDSQTVILKRCIQPRFAELDRKIFFRLVKAGFSARRKKLRSSLAAGLQKSKPEIEELLQMANIDSELRAQNLSLDDWYRLYLVFKKVRGRKSTF